tara:strand:- start:1286 stop:1414 length:129 start_codon:yes stop_codon:yes gene_type:complete
MSVSLDTDGAESKVVEAGVQVARHTVPKLKTIEPTSREESVI